MGASAAIPYFQAARQVLGTMGPWSKSPSMAGGVRKGRSRRMKRGSKKRQGGKKSGGRSITKYHDIRSTYTKRKMGGRKRRAMNFRRKVIKAICEDGPAKQVLMNSPGFASSGQAAQALGVAAGQQNMGVVGSLYTYAGSVNIGEGNRDVYDMLANASVSDIQVYQGSTTPVGYIVPQDSKIRIEGAHSEIMISNPAGGADALVDLYECVCRRDISNSTQQDTLSDLISNVRMAGSAIVSSFGTIGSPATPANAMLTMGVTPFQVDGFVHQFKILKTTRVKIEAGSYTTYTLHDSRMRTAYGEEVVPEVGSQVAKKGWTKILVARAQGFPTTGAAGASTGAFTLYYTNCRTYTVRNLNNKPEEFVQLRVP